MSRVFFFSELQILKNSAVKNRFVNIVVVGAYVQLFDLKVDELSKDYSYAENKSELKSVSDLLHKTITIEL